jgi:hypothetical protein
MGIRTEYSIQTKVIGLKEVKPKGWFVLFDGSYEYLCLGADRPETEVGDAATIKVILNGKQ